MANKPFPFSVCKECCATGGDVPSGDYYTKEEIDTKIEEINDEIEKLDRDISTLGNDITDLEDKTNTKIGDIESALDELHNYAQGLINGGAE